MKKIKCRSKKNCKYFDDSQSSIGYCSHPKEAGLFCNGVCQWFKNK